jgi:uncharacterized protein YjbI with pentapeptide repeats
MVRRFSHAVGMALVIVAALAIPAVGSSTSASAQTVVDGCTIVANPTSTDFTSCPGADLAGADLSGVNLSFADFAGADLATCTGQFPFPDCSGADLNDANLSQANLTNTTLVYCVNGNGPGMPPSCAAATFENATLDNTNLSDADLVVPTLDEGVYIGSAVADFTDATLTGANFTGTALVPFNQTVTATSGAGASVMWSTPGTASGATPGSCTPASGSTFPVGTTTVTCQVLDAYGNAATGTFQVTVEPFTQVLVPENNAVVSGISYLDASASDAAGVNKVVFELSGGTLSNRVIATAKPTEYGWLGQWNTTTVPNGVYSLVSLATDADNDTDTSTPVSVTVDNPPPSSTVLIPSSGASVSGVSSVLNASTSANVSKVTYELSGGPSDLVDQVIATGTPTYYGWLTEWNTTSVPNGAYSLQSVAFAGGESGPSASISITVDN